MIKTYRGQLADGGQDQIRLQTIKGKVGYRIVKFEMMNEKPSSQDYEQIYKIYKTLQTTITNEIHFTDSDLLASAFDNGQGGTPGRFYKSIIFDREIFNQDIYITMIAASGGGTTNGNYYLELEVIPLDDAGAEYTTLKDMR